MNSNFHPNKVFTFCPQCGKKSIQEHSSKSMECTECGFIFFTNAAGAVAAIIKNSDNKILLTVRAFNPGKGMLDLPGGFVDPGESAEEALVREIKEELNLDITDYTYYASFPNEYVYKNVLYFTIDMVFECSVNNLNNIKVDDDVTDYEFVEITDNVIQNVGLPSIKKILKAYSKKL